MNRRGQQGPRVVVGNKDVVAVYANVDEGRYLTVGGVGVRFLSSPGEVREDALVARAVEFRVKRVGKKWGGEDTPLRFGESITLECVSKPGWFLVVESTVGGGAKLVLSNGMGRKSKFSLYSPTLRDLVQLRDTSPASVQSSSLTGPVSASGLSMVTPLSSQEVVSSPPAKRQRKYRIGQPDPEFMDKDELALIRKEEEREQAWMNSMALFLPMDLIKKVFQYKQDWIHTSRLVCKSWRLDAERSIQRIRVNGEFSSLDSVEEIQGLTEFLRRCQNLEVLTLRNVLTLTDDDIAKIIEDKPFLCRLVLGGCRRLSDKSTDVIAQRLRRLSHLNMAFTGITDESLRMMSEHVYKLKELNLYRCLGVTAAGVNRVEFNALEHLNLRGTVLDSTLVQDLRRRTPDTIILTGPASLDSIWG